MNTRETGSIQGSGRVLSDGATYNVAYIGGQWWLLRGDYANRSCYVGEFRSRWGTERALTNAAERFLSAHPDLSAPSQIAAADAELAAECADLKAA